MDTQEVKRLLRNLNRYKSKSKELQERVEIFRTQAEKITPSYGNSGGGSGFNSSSKVEDNVIKYEQLLDEIKRLDGLVAQGYAMMGKLKSYQRYIVRSCLVYHMSYMKMAERENTTSHNVKKICDNAIRKMVE